MAGEGFTANFRKQVKDNHITSDDIFVKAKFSYRQ